MPQNPSIGPLSMQWATRDIFCVISASSNIWWKVWLVYWKPRSLWNSGCASGLAFTVALNVSNTIGFVVVVTNNIRNDTSVVQVKDGTQIDFVNSSYHLNSITSVSHFIFGLGAWKLRPSTFSATYCGLAALFAPYWLNSHSIGLPRFASDKFLLPQSPWLFADVQYTFI